MDQRIAIFFLGLIYLAGMLGIYWAVHPGFILLTPLNLLISLAVALYFHPDRNVHLWRFMAMCYVLGFGAEMFGVQTGLLFGEYTYGKVLGPKVWGTPLIIGINWILVSYTAGMTVNAIGARWSWPIRAIIGALLLVGLDLFIEPVAIRYGFWEWGTVQVPLRNYLGWFGVALPLQAFFAFHFGQQKNKVAVVLFIFQFLFFLFLSLY